MEDKRRESSRKPTHNVQRGARGGTVARTVSTGCTDERAPAEPQRHDHRVAPASAALAGRPAGVSGRIYRGWPMTVGLLQTIETDPVVSQAGGRLLRAAFDRFPHGLMVVHRSRTVVAVNPALRRLLAPGLL